MKKILLINGHPNPNCFVYGRPSVNQLKKSVIEFCGIKPVNVTNVGPVRSSKTGVREKWLQKIERLGEAV
jgi:NAD(P)H dehydrogenase (quinone)